MFGSHFYHATVRKSVALFGTLFNDMHIIRKNNSGGILSQIRVPLSYGPKEKFLSRLDTDTGRDKSMAIKLPRMAFEITSLSQDSTSNLSKLNRIIREDSTDVTKNKIIQNCVTHDIGISLYILTKSQDDGLQLVEQILPYFQPDYTVTIKPVDGFDFKQDVPIILEGVNIDDQYEGDYATRRVLVYQLDFKVKMKFFSAVTDKPIIRNVEVDLENIDSIENSKILEEIDFAVGETDTPDDFNVTEEIT